MVANHTLLNLINNEEYDEARKFLSSGPTDGSEDDFMANILYQHKYGSTTLTYAVYYKAPTDIITSLIDKGGKELIMMKDKYGQTALHWACDGTSVEVVKHLLDVGGVELIGMKDKYNNASDEVKDAIRTFDFNTIIKSNRLNLPLLESFVNGWGIDGLFTRLDDEGSPPIKLIAESNPSVNVIRYIIEKGAVRMGETEKYRDKYPTLRSDWNDLLEKARISFGLNPQILKPAPIEVGEAQCLANGTLIDLPYKVSRSVAESAFELLFEAARNGVGEGTQAKGMLFVIGTLDDFKKIGYCDEGMNTFKGTQIDVRNWKAFKERILPCFVKDGAFCVDGETGYIISDGFIIELPTRNADKGGGTGHRNASAAGAEGFLAIKCSEDSCATDGMGKKDLKVFSGTKVPTMVPVKPENS